jgi:chromosome segregation protein
VLKLRKVELLGFKSFFEKTPITFSGTGVTCIVGPNGCGKSNVVDAVSWVLGEQSHKMLRAERMSDCIFNGTAKKPPLGMAEVTLTLVDPELSEAVTKVIDGAAEEMAPVASGDAVERAETAPREQAEEVEPTAEETGKAKFGKKRAAAKPAIALRPGEVVVGRRLYRSGQSEYLINGRVARLRDVQEIFMGIGLGPDSYAIIEQGRIGQILNSKPMDRRAIIEEAAGITMYKTKKRLAEAKLEASKLNLSRVNDIFVEVEKQLASLKRQASKARRYVELRDQMRGLLRSVLASKAQHLDIEAVRLESLLRDMEAVEARDARAVAEMASEQERLTARTYDLDAELRNIQNMLGQTALDLDRTENRITFNREQSAQIDSRAAALLTEVAKADAQVKELNVRYAAHSETVTELRRQTAALEEALREASERVATGADEERGIEAAISEARHLASQLTETSARQHAESLQAEEAAARYASAQEGRAASIAAVEEQFTALQSSRDSAESNFVHAEQAAQEMAEAVKQAQANVAKSRQAREETSQQLEEARRELSGERARCASLEQILRERAYTADAVQKLFNVSGTSAPKGFKAVGLLADYAEVQEEYEAAVEQFLREELEYVVVESFDDARAGVAVLQEQAGGRATFFVDAPDGLDIEKPEIAADFSMPGNFVARLDRLVEFREPLGFATKQFLTKLRTAYIVESAAVAEQMARANPHSYFLTMDGTCYHSRTITGGRKSDAGPLALKRELRRHETQAQQLEEVAAERESELATIDETIAASESHLAAMIAQRMEAEKSLVAATHQKDQAAADFRRVEQQLGGEREEIGKLRREAEEAGERAIRARSEYSVSLRLRTEAEARAQHGAEELAALRRSAQQMQELVAARRAELAAITERLAGAESAQVALTEEVAEANSRSSSLRQQHESLLNEKHGLESSCAELARQAENLRIEKARVEEQKLALEDEWKIARTRSGEIEETLRTRRQSLDELRAERSQRQIEKARNDADRDYLRQTCVSELNSQPEELMAQERNLLAGEELIAAETNFNEMKARIEAMGPVNMMALEEFRECEEREAFLRRERDDLVSSIENTNLTINELDQVSQQKFQEAFNFINAHFAIAFQTLFGGGTGEMRLSEPDSSGDAGIDIVAQPPGKRLQNILLLSGGEKALTALALLIAVFRYAPSPFCILDEVDAPLDEANVGRFNKMLADMCRQTQFIVVTHNRKTMEMGSVLYGVTMQEPGVSKLVSVKWEEEAAATAPIAAASNAA